jgi:hypothetical protein
MRKKTAIIAIALLFSFQLVVANSESLVLDFCKAQKDINCPTTFSHDVAPIEKKFITFKQ